jgi:ArsR family metal-binding transcriptional regulator
VAKETSRHGEGEEGLELGDLLFSGKLVERIEIGEVSVCVADVDRIKFIAQADRPLGEVLSILYLYLPNANYSEGLGMVSYKQNRRLATVFSTGKIGMTYVKDKQEAERLVEELRGLINRAITYHIIHGSPDSKLIDAKRRLSVKTVYDSLPRTNCKECGEDSCYAFAIRLTNGDQSLDSCKPLLSTSNIDKATLLRNTMQPIRI